MVGLIVYTELGLKLEIVVGLNVGTELGLKLETDVDVGPAL